MIERDGRLLVVVEATHTQGKSRASGYVQLQARDVRSGTKYVERLSPSDMIERVTMDRVDYTFLFAEGKGVVLMHPETFEQARPSRGPKRQRTTQLSLAYSASLRLQFEIPSALLGDAGAFLTDGVTVTVAKLQSGEAVSATLPDTIEAEVTACSASMKARARVVRPASKPASCTCGGCVQPGVGTERGRCARRMRGRMAASSRRRRW